MDNYDASSYPEQLLSGNTVALSPIFFPPDVIFFPCRQTY